MDMWKSLKSGMKQMSEQADAASKSLAKEVLLIVINLDTPLCCFGKEHSWFV